MKPEEFAVRFFEVAQSMGLELSPAGNVVTSGGKNISQGKAATLYRRYGDACAKCPSSEFKCDSKGLKQFRMIAEKALG